MELVDLLGSVANVLILCLMLSGIPTSIQIKRNKSVENVSYIPLALGFFNSCLWLNYGLLLANPVLYLINIIGVVLQSFYLGCYYCFHPDEAFMNKLIVGMIATLGLIVGYTSFWASAEHGTWAAGLIGSLVTMFFVAAPLADVSTVIRTKSTACLPLFMIVMNLILGSLFLVYGYLLNDPFIQIPNGIGLITSIFALSLYVIYPSKPVSKTS